VPQVGIGVAPEITQKSCVMGELQKFALNYIVRAEIPSCHNGRP
jgi:hypothetical protein